MARIPRYPESRRPTRLQARGLAALVVLALTAAACSGDDDGGAEQEPVAEAPQPDEPEVEMPSVDPAPDTASIEDLLGTQAVQDVTIHLGMWVVRDGEAVSFYDSLLEDAGASAGDPVALDGGMIFRPVRGLDGRMVDGTGAEIPSLSVDFGLLSADPVRSDALVDELVAGIDPELTEEQADEFVTALSESQEPAPLLVEIVTADLGSARTHVGPSDRSRLDITSVEEVAPGDAVGVEYLFAQTLPGDPAAEAGASPIELFARRWDHGLIRFLGDRDVATPFLDTSPEVIEGSTILSRLVKAAVLSRLDAALERPDLPSIVDIMMNTTRPSSEYVLGDPTITTRRDGSEVAIPPVEPGYEGEISVTLPGSDEPVALEWVLRGREGRFTIEFGGERFEAESWPEAKTRLQLIAARIRCVALAGAARALNIAQRYDRSPRWIDFSTPLEDEDGLDLGRGNPLVTGPPRPDLGCAPPPWGDQPPRPSGGIAYGDVRMTTFDGTFYTNNAAGEFLLYDDDAATVQMRLEPVETGRIGVSVATAAAIEIDGHELSLHLDGSAWIDGEPADFERGEIRALGGAEVSWWGEGWVMVAPDGTLIRVDENIFSFVIRVDPADGAAPTGLLGDADGDPGNDLVLRDGTPFDGHPVSDFERLYAEFIESWRISADESLFHYEAGETTESFTIEGFPTDRAVIDELTGEERAMGEEACAAAGVVLEGELLDACIVDVAVTGEPALALDSFDAQILALERLLAEPDPVDVSAETPGDTVLTIGGDSLVFGTDPPNQRDGGVRPTWDCEITDGNLFADGRIDLADGPRYTISVQYLANEPRFTLTVQRTVANQTSDHAWVLTNAAHFADAVDSVTLDGTRLTASGELFVNDPPQPGLAPFSQIPEGATLDPFTLDLDCGGSP